MKKDKAKLQSHPSLIECREFQLNGLLNWKTYDDTFNLNIEENEYKKFNFDDITKIDLEQYAKNLEAILINFPWNLNDNYNFKNFVYLKF